MVCEIDEEWIDSLSRSRARWICRWSVGPKEMKSKGCITKGQGPTDKLGCVVRTQRRSPFFRPSLDKPFQKFWRDRPFRCRRIRGEWDALFHETSFKKIAPPRTDQSQIVRLWEWNEGEDSFEGWMRKWREIWVLILVVIHVIGGCI